MSEVQGHAVPVAMVRRPRLYIGVKRAPWRTGDSASLEADLEFKQARREALTRQADGRCVFCGFETKVEPKSGRSGFFDLHHANDDHADNRPENLILACPFCHQYFHIGMAAMRGSAYLIAMPDARIGAERLNYIMHLSHVRAARCGLSGFNDWLAALREMLAAGRAFLEENFEYSDIGLLARALHTGSPDTVREIHGDLARFHVRVVPDLDCHEFRPMIEMWNLVNLARYTAGSGIGGVSKGADLGDIFNDLNRDFNRDIPRTLPLSGRLGKPERGAGFGARDKTGVGAGQGGGGLRDRPLNARPLLPDFPPFEKGEEEEEEEEEDENGSDGKEVY